MQISISVSEIYSSNRFHFLIVLSQKVDNKIFFNCVYFFLNLIRNTINQYKYISVTILNVNFNFMNMKNILYYK